MVHDPEICLCSDCTASRIWFLKRDLDEPLFPHVVNCNCYKCCLWRASEFMRSNHPKTIEISVVRGKCDLPPFLSMFHRHFEKSSPAVSSAEEASVVAPVDLLLMMLQEGLGNSIESVDVLYRKGGIS